MIYSIAQTVAFASLAGAVFTSSQSSSFDLLSKSKTEYFAKWLTDTTPSVQSSKITLNQKNIDEEDQAYAVSVSARASPRTMDNEDPSFVEFAYYSDSACKVKEYSFGSMLNECIVDQQNYVSYVLELYGKNKQKVARHVWNNVVGCWV